MEHQKHSSHCSMPEKKALQGGCFRVIKRLAEAFCLALGGRWTLGAGSSVIPEIHCRGRAAEALLPSLRGLTIGGLHCKVTLPELRVELRRLACDQEILCFLTRKQIEKRDGTSKQIEKKETECWRRNAGGWVPGGLPSCCLGQLVT
jgi:hypothetical protein